MHMKEISRKCLIFPGCSPIIKRKERLKNRVKKKNDNCKKTAEEVSWKKLPRGRHSRILLIAHFVFDGSRYSSS